MFWVSEIWHCRDTVLLFCNLELKPAVGWDGFTLIVLSRCRKSKSVERRKMPLSVYTVALQHNIVTTAVECGLWGSVSILISIMLQIINYNLDLVSMDQMSQQIADATKSGNELGPIGPVGGIDINRSLRLWLSLQNSLNGLYDSTTAEGTAAGNQVPSQADYYSFHTDFQSNQEQYGRKIVALFNLQSCLFRLPFTPMFLPSLPLHLPLSSFKTINHETIRECCSRPRYQLQWNAQLRSQK